DESPFVEREENYEIYREIYGDPIYDVYEDDVRVVDFVFSEDFFANFVCAKIGQDEIRAKFGRDKIRANPDESPFVEREENYEIYREIYGDPIYDVYEDDVRVVDFVFSEDFFANFVCAKIGQDEIRAKFGRDKIRANPVQDELHANFGE
ncbi:hypothetical protein HID58_035247, partial [Brassica napus]